jgi:hypothetical protein
MGINAKRTSVLTIVGDYGPAAQRALRRTSITTTERIKKSFRLL